MKMQKKSVLALLSILLLSGCASQEPIVVPVVLASVPTSCAPNPVLTLLQKNLANAQFIDTPWQPAAGTELADVINNGGIACTYGDQTAEIGITAMWVKDSGSLFSNRIDGWLSSDFVKVDLPEISEESAYYLYKGQSPTQEFHIWLVNMQVNGIWIQVSSTMANSITDGLPYLRAAVEALS